MRVLLVALTACTVAQVPTDRARISWVRHGTHGHYEKLYTQLEGTTCGEQYMNAVSGIPAAEDLMRRCYTHNLGYGAGMLGFVVFPAAGLTTALVVDDRTVGGTALGISLGLGVASFAFGVLEGAWAGHDLADGVHAYNAAIDTGVEQR